MKSFLAPLVSSLFLLLFVSCGESLKKEDLLYTEDDVAIEVGRNVEILYSDSAIVRVRVVAPLLHNYTGRYNSRQEFPQGVKVEFFGPDGKIRSTLTSKLASRNQETGIIAATDSVIVQTVKSERLETQELIWDEKKETLNTEKFVKISRPDKVFFGYGLEASQDFSYWKIKVPTGTMEAQGISE